MQARVEGFAINLAASAIWAALASGVVGLAVGALGEALLNLPTPVLLGLGLAVGLLVYGWLQRVRSGVSGVRIVARSVQITFDPTGHVSRKLDRLNPIIERFAQAPLGDSTLIRLRLLRDVGRHFLLNCPDVIVRGEYVNRVRLREQLGTWEEMVVEAVGTPADTQTQLAIDRFRTLGV